MVTKVLQITNGLTPLLLVNAGKYLVMIDISNPGERIQRGGGLGYGD
jgi:hypothetical protein